MTTITNIINCFLPVVNNEKDIKLNYFFNLEELPSTYWFKEKSKFSIPFKEYVKVEHNISNPESLLNKIVYSLTSSAKSKIVEVDIINGDLILKLDYFFAEYFQNNEIIISENLSEEDEEITMKIVEKYSSKPETLFPVENNEINKLRKNTNFTLSEFTQHKYNHNNHIVKIKNNFTKKNSIIFYQTTNKTDII